ncbi:MAG: precorrin-4 C(11)-methyltransferase [Calditerrivibrio sp.]|nr:precorrin-4 C(11)-methyltransferase [Calditerrivibrio sp.]
MNRLYFVGAGPGDPELISLKGFKLLSEADVIIYTGSLINKDILKYAKPDALLIDSAHLNLNEILELIKGFYKENKKIVRLHTGEPALYGAIYEQMLELEKSGIDFEVIPGISSMQLAASRLKVELTAPEISQTVVVTRIEGKTPVPETEKLEYITKSTGTFIFFLSAGFGEQIQSLFLKNGWNSETPAAICYKLGFDDEKIIMTDLLNLPSDLKNNNITKHALIIIGHILKKENIKKYSKLYDEGFKHAFRP